VILAGRRGGASDRGSASELPSGGNAPGKGTDPTATGEKSGGQSGDGRQSPAGGGTTPSGAGSMPSADSESSGGSQGGMGNEETILNDIPADISAAADDDVLARQLREAAMNETDPALREKLWEEYRRYIEG